LLPAIFVKNNDICKSFLGTIAQMERENIKFRLDSGRELYKRGGDKLGRKTGYRKPKEQNLKQYA
jgi:DNA invertase Pin-like site-specific DNA recombinase